MLSIASNATPSRIAFRSRARQKAGVKDEPPAKRHLRLGKLWWWMVAAIASAIGWQMWELHLYNAAIREAKEAGFIWKCEDTLSLIREDWRNALKKETWGANNRVLVMRRVPCLELDRCREMLHRLRPTVLHVLEFGDQNVDAFKGLTDLQYLKLIRFPALQNVDALKSLTGLQSLDLSLCFRIPAAALRELRAALPNTDITFPDGSKNPPH